MRFMMIVKASPESETGAVPKYEDLAEMGKFNELLREAGVLVDLSGLKASKFGCKVEYRGKERLVIDGPFTETKELIAGYWVINVKSLDEAVGWAKRVPFDRGAVEIRPFFELDDFEPSPAVDRARELEAKLRK